MNRFTQQFEKCLLVLFIVRLFYFVDGNHGDKMPFDDGGNLKAHAFFPAAGSDIHFDEYESWVDDPNGVGGISLLTVAIHEIGHSLGLMHSSARNTVMSTMLSKGKNSLFDDDIKGIQALYGKCLIQKLDAVVTSTAKNYFKNKALVFKNEWVWDVDIMTRNIMPGYPRKIDDLFKLKHPFNNKHPFKVVFYEHKYNTYVFMNDNGYFLVGNVAGFPIRDQYTYDASDSFFPFLEDVGVPDAAFVDPYSHDIYHFFKGKQYYKFDMGNNELMPNYPKAINTEWPNVPNDLDASYYSYDEKAYYFIKSNQYYKLVKKNKKLVFHSIGILNDIFKNICPI